MSFAAIIENRPIAIAPTKIITMPSPVKKPSSSPNCRIVRCPRAAVAGPVGTPGVIVVFFSTTVTTPKPVMNQAPPSAPRKPPRTPTVRLRVISTNSPPISAAAPGTTDR